MTRKPTVPEVLPLFAAYPGRERCWGSLHAVLSDHNVEVWHVRWSATHACATMDAEGLTLALLLLCMSRTQRLAIARKLPG